MSATLQLPLLSARQKALETCGYCPKLCRATCPVSNAEPKDTLTPWGKMSLSWFLARGDVPVEASYAKVAWACTGCFACRERCDHRNPVVDTLNDARADLVNAGVAPVGALRVKARQDERVLAANAALGELRDVPGVDANASTALLIGCAYQRHLPAESRAIVTVAATLADGVRLLDGCCGASLDYAGDRDGAERARSVLRSALGGASLLVADPGCALALRGLGARSLVELAARELGRLSRIADLSTGAAPRWHDPCQLGRGLGLYDPPRALLARLAGRPPAEFARRREHATCSGAGGILPSTMPEVSALIADERLRQHDELGGGPLVTACASSLRRFRSRGIPAVDLMTLVAQGL